MATSLLIIDVFPVFRVRLASFSVIPCISRRCSLKLEVHLLTLNLFPCTSFPRKFYIVTNFLKRFLAKMYIIIKRWSVRSVNNTSKVLPNKTLLFGWKHMLKLIFHFGNFWYKISECDRDKILEQNKWFQQKLE